MIHGIIKCLMDVLSEKANCNTINKRKDNKYWLYNGAQIAVKILHPDQDINVSKGFFADIQKNCKITSSFA